MSRYKRLISNTAILGVGTFASKVLVFLLMPLYTSVLSTEEFGYADLIAQTANLIIPLASVGICDALFRFTLDAEEGERKRIFGASVGVLTIGSAVLCAIAAVLCVAKIPNSEALPMIVGYVVAANFHSAFAHYLRAKGKTVLFAVQGIVNTALTIGLNILFLVVFDMGAEGYVMSVVISDALLAIGLFFVGRLWRELRFSRRREGEKSVVGSILKFSIPYIPTTMLWLITSVSDRYIVNAYCGTANQGLYTAASKLPTLILLVSGVFIEAWHFSSVKDASAEERSSFFGNVFKNYMGIMFLGASVLIAGSKLFTRILLADSYYSSWEFVPILVVAMVFSAFSAFFGSVYFLEKKSLLSMLTALSGAVINVILNFLLIPRHGAMGAAVATMISYMATYAIRAYDTAHYLRFDQHFIRVAVNTLALLAQCVVMIEAVPYWKYIQVGIVLFLLVFNGREIAKALSSFIGGFFKKAKGKGAESEKTEKS